MDQQQQQQQAPLEPIDHDAAAAAAAEIGVKYVCGDCGGENVIKLETPCAAASAATASSTRSARSASSSSRPADGAAVSRPSAGAPSASRNVQSCAVRLESGEYVVVDCGEGTQQQLLKASRAKSFRPSRT